MGKNANKFSFIICYNNELMLSECLYYIDKLNVPEGVETDVITISEADSMAGGYNAGLNSSDAKYKVYMHQDVFIVNRNFISDCIRIFEHDHQIGLIGLLGCDRIPENLVVYLSWNVGACYAANPWKVVKIEDKTKAFINDVEAVDGMLMVTSVDVTWREDIFDGWDFYDVSQAMEFHKAGYRVVVPHQGEPWCLHDCGNSKLLQYDKYRKAFSNEYRDGFSCEPDEILSKDNRELLTLCKSLEKRFSELLASGRKKQVQDELIEAGMAVRNGNILMLLYLIQQIDDAEGRQQHTLFWNDSSTLKELTDKWNTLKFLIRRIEFGVDGDAEKKLVHKIYSGEYSWEAVILCVSHVAKNKLAVMNVILRDSFEL